MFKIYDSHHVFVKMIDKCKNPCETTTLATGTKTLSFSFPLKDEYLEAIAEEYYIETADYEYVVKEINLEKNNFFKVYCNPNLEGLKYSLISTFDAFEVSIEQCLSKALSSSHSDWTLDYKSSNQTMVTYQMPHVSAYDIFELIRTDFSLDIIYDTKNKKVIVYDKIGKNLGAYFTNELKLKLLKRQGQSYNFATVLYPIGKNGLTIADINNGKIFLENFSYCDKFLPAYWIQDDIEHAEELKMKGEAYLNQISCPVVSYGLTLDAIPKRVEIGDNITLIDKIKRIKQKQRVVKIIRYPFEPEKDKIEISNQIVNFANTFIKTNSALENQIDYIKKNLSTLK